MKTVKRLGMGLLCMMMVFTCMITSFASEPVSVTIEPGDLDLSGITYKAYKVMDVTENSGNYGYAMTSDFKNFFLDKGYTTSQQAYDYLNKSEVSQREAVRDELKSYVDTQSLKEIASVAGDGKNAVTMQLNSGFYIVIPSGSDTTYKANLITVTKDPVTLYVKGKQPVVDKQADDEDWTSAQIGDAVSFLVTSNVPDMTGQTAYYFRLVDTMSKGLTLSSTVEPVVKIGSMTLQKDVDYTVKTETISGTQETKLTITFINFIQHASKAGETITFSYTAVLNENAIITDQETNRAQVDYGNDPEFNQSSQPDTTIIKDHELTITKQDGEQNPLPNAKFQLYRGDGTSSSPIKFVDKKDGTYEVATQQQISQNQDITDILVSTSNGTIIVKGLDSGIYTLVEIEAPEGYNLLDTPQKIEIVAESLDHGTNVSVSGNTITVTNEKGVELPSTGGMGTILFTVVGVLLISAAAGSFVLGRKKEN